MTYGAQFMLASAYTLLKDGHIRTDVFYQRWSAKTRATIDSLSYVLFFFPGHAVHPVRRDRRGGVRLADR